MISFETVKPLLSWIHLHPSTANLIVFLIACGESIAIIGLVIPGSVLLIGIGTLIGSDVLSPSPTILAAIFGALTGDILSYWVGYHYRLSIHHMWPFYHWPNMLRKGEDFFQKHGRMGVFLGRFIGPIRPITPLVAGMMKMRTWQFLIIDILSAILWAIAYMLPGIILGGAATSEASPEVATRFILTIFAALFGIWVIYWLIKKSLRVFFHSCQRMLDKGWQLILNSPRLIWFRDLLASPAVTPEGNQLDIFCLLVISVIGLLITTYHVKHSGFLTSYNEYINYFFRGVRTNYIDHLMIAITLLGQESTLLLFAAAMWVWFMVHRCFREANYWLLTIFLTGACAFAIKHFLHIPRPLGIKGANILSWSYPSGHATVATATLGFFIVMITQHFSREVRFVCYLATTILLALILFTRIYLGAHWLTDVVGGLFLGCSILFFTTLLYRRKISALSNPKLTFGFALFILLSMWSLFFLHSFNKESEKYTQTWSTQSITMQLWWTQQGTTESPFYRPNRFGKPIQTINLQWIGDINQIRNTLTTLHWQKLNTGAFRLLLLGLGLNNHEKKLPLLAPFYQSHPPILTMYLPINDQIMLLRLWSSYIIINDRPYPLYIGTINYYHPWHPRLLHHRKRPQLPALQAPDLLALSLKKFPIWQFQFANYHQYPALNHKDDIEWTGKVLLIRPKEKNHG